jgi:hypothetical protein
MKISRFLVLSPLLLSCAAWAAGPAPSEPSNMLRGPKFSQTVDPNLPPVLAIPRKDGERQTCYSIRSYRFRRPDAESDTTKMESYSTCQTADLFSRKDAVEPAPGLLR